MVEAESRWLNLGFWNYSRLFFFGVRTAKLLQLRLFHVFVYFVLETHECTSEFQTE